METVDARDLVGFSAISSKWHPCPGVRESPEVKQQALGACEARGEGAGSVLRSTVKFDFIDPCVPTGMCSVASFCASTSPELRG